MHFTGTLEHAHAVAGVLECGVADVVLILDTLGSNAGGAVGGSLTKLVRLIFDANERKNSPNLASVSFLTRAGSRGVTGTGRPGLSLVLWGLTGATILLVTTPGAMKSTSLDTSEGSL